MKMTWEERKKDTEQALEALRPKWWHRLWRLFFRQRSWGGNILGSKFLKTDDGAQCLYKSQSPAVMRTLRKQLKKQKQLNRTKTNQNLCQQN